MTRQEFLTTLQEMLQCDMEMHEDTVLTDLEEWDSLAFMVVIAFFDKNFGQRITFDTLKGCRTPSDLIALSAGAIA